MTVPNDVTESGVSGFPAPTVLETVGRSGQPTLRELLWVSSLSSI